MLGDNMAKRIEDGRGSHELCVSKRMSIVSYCLVFRAVSTSHVRPNRCELCPSGGIYKSFQICDKAGVKLNRCEVMKW